MGNLKNVQMTNFPNGFPQGLTIRNVSVLNTFSGNVFWVDVNNPTAAAGNPGTFDLPINSIDNAINTCVANNGDIILVNAGHTETITAAAGIAADVAGVSIIGLGSGNDRPRLTFSTSTAASVTLPASSLTIQNVIGISGIDGLLNPFNVTGDDVYLDIEWQDSTSLVEATRAILLTGVDRGTVNLTYRGQTGGNACVNGVRLVNCTGIIINANFYGLASTSWVEFLTTASANIEVYGYMYNSGTTDGSKDVIDTVTGSTWFGTVMDGSAGATYSGGSASAWASDDSSAIAANQTVPTANSTANVLERDVIGNKTDTGVQAVTTTVGLLAYLKGVLDILAGTAGITSFPAAAAAGNAVSLSEVIRYGQDSSSSLMMDRNASNYLSVTADLTSVTWNTVAAHEIATVTGMVHLLIIPEVTGTVTSGGGAATLVLGDETTADSIIASTDSEALATGEVWFDTTTTRTLAATSIYEKTNIVVGGGKDIGYTIGTEALTGGSIVFHMWWRPISATGAVVAGAGGPL